VWLHNNGEDAAMPLEVAAKHPAVLAELQKAVDAANAQVSRAESIRKFVVLPTEFTEQSGHLTPKLSIKRGEILKDFAQQIEALYSNAPATEGFSLR
jgi:long-chain acyl-CoA synthetase